MLLRSSRRWLHAVSSAKVATANVVPLSALKFTPDAVVQPPTKCPLLVFHGLFGSKHNWKTASREFARRTQRTVYAFDLRNHGESPSADGSESSLDAMAGDVMHFVRQNALEKVALLGHSLGGRVISQFAFNWPDKVEKLVLVDALPVNHHSLETREVSFLQSNFFHLLTQSIKELPSQTKIGEARKEVGKRLMDLLKDEHFVGFLLMSLRKEGGTIKWRFDAANLGRMVQSGFINQINLRQPFQGRSLLIYGEHSQFVRQNVHEEVRQAMPQVELTCIKGTGHYLHIEKPDQFADLVVNFLQ